MEIHNLGDYVIKVYISQYSPLLSCSERGINRGINTLAAMGVDSLVSLGAVRIYPMNGGDRKKEDSKIEI